MKRIIALVIVAVICFVTVGCSTPVSNITTPSTTTMPETTEGANNTPAVRDLAALKGEMITKFKVSDSIEFNPDLLLNMYGITAADVAEIEGYMTLEGVFPEEVIMIKVSNEDGKTAIVSALEKRIAEVKVQSQNYDAENYALAQKCKVESDGLYVTMFLSPNVEAMTGMFYGN